MTARKRRFGMWPVPMACRPKMAAVPIMARALILENCAPSSGSGAGELKTLWSDPTYQSGEAAAYYVTRA